MDTLLAAEGETDEDQLQATASKFNTIFLNQHSVEAARLACGAVIAAGDAVLDGSG